MKRSIENRLDDLEQEAQSGDVLTVAFGTPGSDELTDDNGEPINEDEVSGILVVIEETLVMPREQAEAEGRTILGPCEDANEDAVRVAIND